MRLSTRSRYGMRLMVVLASKEGGGPVFLKEIAGSEGISEKYLGQIIIPLKARGLLLAFRGARGGYTLSRSADLITLREIVETLEGDLKLVNCADEPSSCTRNEFCSARGIWNDMSTVLTDFLESHTLADLLGDKECSRKRA